METNETYFKELKNDLHDLGEQKRLDDIEAQQKEKLTMDKELDEYEFLEGC